MSRYHSTVRKPRDQLQAIYKKCQGSTEWTSVEIETVESARGKEPLRVFSFRFQVRTRHECDR